jgi:hypothetical protein
MAAISSSAARIALVDGEVVLDAIAVLVGAPAVSGRYQVSTGKVRPDTSTIGAPSKCSEKRSRSMVAEVMITLRSGDAAAAVLR